MCRFIFFFLLTISIFSSFAAEEFNLDVSYAKFLDNEDKGKADLEIYLTFPLKDLQFSQNPEDSSIFDAAYIVKVWLNDVNQESIYQNTDQTPHFAVVRSLDEIKENSLAVELVRMSVPAGVYKLQVGVVDANTQKLGVKEIDNVEVSLFSDKLIAFSDLELATKVEPVAKVESSLVKNNYFIIPNPTSTFMADKDRLAAYFEIYNLPKSSQKQEIPVSFEIWDSKGTLADSKTFTYIQDGKDGFFVGSMPITNLLPGNYSYKIIVSNKESPLYTYTKDIIVTSSKAGLAASNNISDELAKQIRDEIRLIATEKELNLWDQLGPSQRPEFLKAFWMRRDPNQDNPQVDNEYRRMFYERLKYIDENFSFLGKLGRDSDQGKVYLTYGKPDESARDPMGISSMVDIDTSSWTTKGAVAWVYDNLGPNSTKIWFVFVDQNGDGIFRIYSSNVKGWGKYQPSGSTNN